MVRLSVAAHTPAPDLGNALSSVLPSSPLMSSMLANNTVPRPIHIGQLSSPGLFSFNVAFTQPYLPTPQ